MATYEGVEYVLMNSVTEKWGIDVTVRFSRDDIFKYKTFGFENQGEIDSSYDDRMEKAIDNYIEDRERDITPDEIVSKINAYFQTHTEITRAQAKAYMDEKVMIDGAI